MMVPVLGNDQGAGGGGDGMLGGGGGRDFGAFGEISEFHAR